MGSKLKRNMVVMQWGLSASAIARYVQADGNKQGVLQEKESQNDTEQREWDQIYKGQVEGQIQVRTGKVQALQQAGSQDMSEQMHAQSRIHGENMKAFSSASLF